MKEVKRIMVAAAAAVMALTAAGCSSSSSSSSSKSSSKVYKIGICQLVQHEALDAATKGFKEEDLAGRLPASVAQGLFWVIMALGVYITFRILDIAYLTVDGTFATGGAVS